MRLLFLGALAGILCASAASAQSLNLSDSALTTTRYHGVGYDPSTGQHHMVFPFSVPGGTIAIIGLKRMEGSGDVDVEVARDFRGGTERASAVGLLASSANSGSSPELVFVPPTGGRQALYYHVYSHDHRSGEWRVSMEYFNLSEELTEAAATAMVQWGIECGLLTDCSRDSTAPNSEMIGRALGIGFAAIQSNSICSFGVNAMVNEVSLQINREFQGYRFLQIMASNMFSSFLGKAADTVC